MYPNRYRKEYNLEKNNQNRNDRTSQKSVNKRRSRIHVCEINMSKARKYN